MSRKNFRGGVSYDVELSGVDHEGSFVPASGGLRLSYIAQMDRAAPLTLHAGDSIAVLTRAKLPQVFRDDGAFDRRAYLSQQGVDLVGALRAPELLELIRPFVFGYRMYRRIGVAMAGRDGAAVCSGASRMARRDEGCCLPAAADAISHRSSFAGTRDGNSFALACAIEISCFVACAELASVTISKSAETPNQNQNNQQ